MGWIGTYKSRTETMDEFFERELSNDKLCFIGKGAFINFSEYYRCMYSENTKTYFVLVCKVRLDKKTGELWYKDMSEDVHPYYYNCPANILALAEQSEPSNESAKEWRTKVHEVLDRKERTRNLQVGDVIRLDKKLNFGNGKFTEDTFVVDRGGFGKKRMKMYYSVDNKAYCKINPNNYNYEVIGKYSK